MKLSIKKISCVLLLVAVLLIAMLIPTTIYARANTVEENIDNSAIAVAEEVQNDETTTEVAEAVKNDTTKHKAWAAGICVALVAVAGAIGMAIVISKAVEGIARQPEADGKIRTTLMLGLVFIETAIIYALIVAILLIFVM